MFPPLPGSPGYEEWLDREFNRTHAGYRELKEAEDANLDKDPDKHEREYYRDNEEKREEDE